MPPSLPEAPCEGRSPGRPDAGPVRIVRGSAIGRLAALEGLARRIFGEGDRPHGWFSRKLRRERVSPARSVVAVRPGFDPQDPQGWCGYVLVGDPPSLAPALRTAGTGVDPSLRGRGVGSQLVRAALRHAAQAGATELQLLADAGTEPFYARHGLQPVHGVVTLLAFGRDQGGTVGPAVPWRPPRPGEHEVIAWLPEAWEGTDPEARGTAHVERAGASATAWLSREGVAWLVQRLVIAPTGADAPLPVVEVAAALREQLGPGRPILLPLLHAHGATARALRGDGWQVAQRGTLLSCRFPPSLT